MPRPSTQGDHGFVLPRVIAIDWSGQDLCTICHKKQSASDSDYIQAHQRGKARYCTFSVHKLCSEVLQTHCQLTNYASNSHANCNVLVASSPGRSHLQYLIAYSATANSALTIIWSKFKFAVLRLLDCVIIFVRECCNFLVILSGSECERITVDSRSMYCEYY